MAATKTNLQAWLLLDTAGDAAPFSTSVRFEISQFSSSFSLNSIPRAKVSVAVGRDAADGLTPAMTQVRSDLFQKMTRARVIMRASGEYAPGLNWPDKEIIIFEGQLLGPNVEFSEDTASYTVDLVHWLNNLDNSSMFTSDSHTANPSAYVFKTFSTALPVSGAPIGEKPLTFGSIAEAALLKDIQRMTEDLWGLGIKTVLSKIADKRIFEPSEEVRRAFGDLSANRAALEALSRIEGVTSADATTSLERSAYTPLLQLRVPDTPGREGVTYVIDAIIKMINSDILNAMGQTTMWNKLAGGYSPDLAFAIVPQVERALVIPFCEGLRATYCKKIRREDYYHINKLDLRFRPTRGVLVLARVNNQNGLPVSDTPNFSVHYVPETNVADGMIKIVGPPAWLTNIAIVSNKVGASSGLDEDAEVNTATTPVDDATVNDDVKKAVEDSKSYFDMYAKWVYVKEALRGRGAQLAGKLRFDICPGSTVEFETTSERILDSTPVVSTFVGTVASVTVTIDCLQDLASTAFTLSGVRTAEENASSSLSVDEHPLYTTFFAGAPLVPDLAFFEEENC